LLGQVEADISKDKENTSELDECLVTGLKSKTLSHKQAIYTELMRRKSVQEERERVEREAAEAKKQRKERR